MSRRNEILQRVNEMPITKEMQNLVLGSSVGNDELKAIRACCVTQFSSLVTKMVRDDFIDFYQKEIIKAKKMGMLLA